MFRSFSRLVRFAIALPVLLTMLWVQYTALTAQRDFETWRAESHDAVEVVDDAPLAAAHNTSPEASHLIGASPVGASPEARSDVFWVLLAAGGAGLSVLAGALALSGLFGTRTEPEGVYPST